MDRSPARASLAVALGAGIGALIALDLGLPFLWLGAVVGSLIGYLTYDFKKVVHAIPRAWDSAVNWRPSNEFKERFHYCTVRKPAAMFYLTMGAWTALLTVVTGIVLAVMCVKFFKGILTTPTIGDLQFLSVIVGICLIGSLFSSIMTGFDWNIPTIETLGWDMFMCNPIRVYCYLLPKYFFKAVVAVIRLLIKLVMNLPEIWRYSYLMAIRGTKAAGRFCYHLVRLIHTDMRMVCMIDAAIFTCIGFFAGNALVGAVIGGIFGALDCLFAPKLFPGLVIRK